MVRALSLKDLWDGDKVGLEIEGQKILLVRLDGEVHAFEDRCCHLGLPLSPGRMSDGLLTCPIHEWQYDARTGRGVNPTHVRLCQCKVEIKNGDIYVDVKGA